MNNVADRFGECPQGEGQVLRTIAGHDLEAYVRNAIGVDPASPFLDEIVLTPQGNNVTHPFWDTTTHGFKRSTNDLRSFYLPAMGETAASHTSLTVKGGDMPYMHDVQAKRGFAPFRRATHGQVPGSCIVGAAQTEYDAGIYLQKRSIEFFGTLAATTIPLRINTISKIRTNNGELVDIVDFANSNEYMANVGAQRKSLGLANGEGLGDLMFKRNGLTACESMYALSGPNVRVNDMYSYRLFGYYDAQNAYDTEAYHESVKDPLFSMNTDVDRMGDNFTPQLGRKDRVVRNVYRILADTYGFNAEEVLPGYEITDDNYLDSLASIAYKCQNQGIDGLVLDRFIQNVVRVAALGHSDGSVFCRGDISGGSFMPRNVTVGGSVVDLDTLGKLNIVAFWRKVPRDIMEMTLSISSIERLVRRDNVSNLFSFVLNSYTDALDATHVSAKQQEVFREALIGSDFVIDAAACLENHDLKSAL